MRCPLKRDRFQKQVSRAAKRGGFKRGGFKRGVSRSGLVLPFLSFLGLSRFFRDFPICLGTLPGFSRFALFLFLGLLTAPARNSPERVRDTIRTFPEKSGKSPGLETPRSSFSQKFFPQCPLCKACLWSATGHFPCPIWLDDRVPDNGNHWKKFCVAPRSYPLWPLIFDFV